MKPTEDDGLSQAMFYLKITAAAAVILFLEAMWAISHAQ